MLYILVIFVGFALGYLLGDWMDIVVDGNRLSLKNILVLLTIIAVNLMIVIFIFEGRFILMFFASLSTTLLLFVSRRMKQYKKEDEL